MSGGVDSSVAAALLQDQGHEVVGISMQLHDQTEGEGPSFGRRRLLRGRDARKDQSYFLFGLSQDQLAHALFPVGGLTKDEVRVLAAARGLPNADKPESQEICFVPDDDYAGFVERQAPGAGRE